MAATYPELCDGTWLYERYIVEDRLAREMAAELGCTPRAVTMAITKHGLQRGRHGRHANPSPVLRSKRKLAALYAELGSITRVAQHLHCRDDAVRNAIDSFGIPRRSYVRYNDRKWFVDALWRGLTVSDMADELGAQRWSIYRALERHGLPRPAPYRGGAG
jgi:hypothetical protein